MELTRSYGRGVAMVGPGRAPYQTSMCLRADVHTTQAAGTSLQHCVFGGYYW